MKKCSLQFTSVSDLCSFIKEANLRNFLLLGKKSILIARYTDATVERAKQAYKATVVETAEIFQIAKTYFGEVAA